MQATLRAEKALTLPEDFEAMQVAGKFTQDNNL
jgi:hypothetical protein